MSHNNFQPSRFSSNDPSGNGAYAPLAAPTKRKRWPWVLVAVVIVLALIGAFAGGGEKTESAPAPSTAAGFAESMPTYQAPTSKLAPPAALPPKPAPAPAPKTPAAYSKDGRYRVPADIAPGDYSFTLKGGSGYWETCANIACEITFDGSDSGMIDNGFEVADGYLTIPPNAAYVKLQGLKLTPA